MEIDSHPGDVRVVALVRDAQGRPVIDDGATISEDMKALLTSEELEELENDRFAFRRTA